MVLAQPMEVASPPLTLPELIRPYHGRVNSEAPESVLQLGSNAWAPLQRTSTATSASTSSAIATDPGSVSSQSSVSVDSSIEKEGTTVSSKKQQAFSIQPAHHSHAKQIRDIGSSVFAATFGFSIPPADLSQYLIDSYSLASIQAELANPNHHFLVAVKPSDASDPIKEQEVLGFAQISYHTTEPCLSHLPQETLVELQRLYVSSKHQSLGVGRALIDAAQHLARSIAATRNSSTVDEACDEDDEADAEENDGDDECDQRQRLRSRRNISMPRRYVSSSRIGKRKDRVINMWLGVWEGNFVAQGVYEKAGFERVGDHEFRMGRCVQIDWIMLKRL